MRKPVVLSDEEFARLCLLLSRAAGLVFDQARRESLTCSIDARLRATGMASVSEYLDVVQRAGSRERQELLDEVTVQETHFFRNPPQVRALRAHVLPELVRAAADTRRLRVWSAGCSTGEEPYTIAMLLQGLLPSAGGWDVQVLGTDVSAGALATARAGVYGARSVQLATPEERDRFFVPREGERYEVRPEVRDLVSFRHHNLVTEPPPFDAAHPVDLVLCRNVTIYFSRETTRTLMSRLHRALRDGGYLFVGHSETLWQVTDRFRLVAVGTGDSAAYVYRRLDTDPQERRRVLPDRRTLAQVPSGGDRRRSGRRDRPRPDPGADRSDPGRGAVAHALPDSEPPSPAAPGPLPAARGALAAGPSQDALRLAEQAALARPLQSSAHRLHAQALLALGRDGEALVALRKVVYLEPDDALSHFQLAGALRRTGHLSAAAREYRAAAALAGRRPRAGSEPELRGSPGLPGSPGVPGLPGRSAAEFVRLCRRLGDQLDAWPEARQERS